MEEVFPFLEIYRAAREEEMQIKIEQLRKQCRTDSSENLKIQILTAQTSLTLHTLLLEHIEEIHVEPSAQHFLEEKLNNFRQRKEPVPQAAKNPTLEFHQYGWWIVFDEAINTPPLPFQIKAAIFAHAADPRLIQKTKSAVQPAAHQLLDTIAEYKRGVNWIIDIISDTGSIEFCMAYDAKAGWKHSGDFHVCPWNNCRFKQEGQLLRACNACNALHSYCRILLGLVLCASRGEFQQSIVAQPRSPRNTAPLPPQPHNSQHTQPDQTHQAPRRIRIVSVDVSERKVYQRNAPPDPHNQERIDTTQVAAAQAQQSDAEQARRRNWLTLHNQDDIELITKTAKAHERHYRDGRVVNVKQSRPRAYKQLKADVAPRRITRLSDKRYEQSKANKAPELTQNPAWSQAPLRLQRPGHSR